MKKKPKVAIVGAGLAGLSAAVYLHEEAEVHLIEASSVCGGRTRSLSKSIDDFAELDNGQHILLGTYQSTLNLLKRINVDQKESFFRAPLRWWMDNGFQLNCPKLPAPFNLVFAIFLAKGIDFKSKLSCLKDFAKLKFAKKDETVKSWLDRNRVASKLQQDFWYPLVLATLNTPISEASILTLKHVANDGLLEAQASSDLLLPAKPLKELFSLPAIEFLSQKKVKLKLNHRVKSIVSDPEKGVWVDDQMFDAVILAVAPFHAISLLEDKNTQILLDGLQYAAICTVYLRYKEKINFPFPMLGVADGTAQWLFDRGALVGADNEVAAVISCVTDNVDKETLVKKVHQDILKWHPNLEEPIAFRVITEKRATFKSTPTRPKLTVTSLSRPGIYLAGDYMHPRYPATIEGAIQSGQIAADRLLLDWNNIE